MRDLWSWLERHPRTERALVLVIFTSPLWLSMGLQLVEHWSKQ